jgi:hypothetical protein
MTTPCALGIQERVPVNYADIIEELFDYNV